MLRADQRHDKSPVVYPWWRALSPFGAYFPVSVQQWPSFGHVITGLILVIVSEPSYSCTLLLKVMAPEAAVSLIAIIDANHYRVMENSRRIIETKLFFGVCSGGNRKHHDTTIDHYMREEEFETNLMFDLFQLLNLFG